MSKQIRVSSTKIKATKGSSNWAYLKKQSDEQIRSNIADDRTIRELSDIELKQLRKAKKT